MQPDTPFLTASTWQRDRLPLRFHGVIDAPWFQGRAAFGGLLCAGIVRSMEVVVGNPRRRVRTLHVHFCAPARAGAIALEVNVERVGATTSTLSARCTQAEGTVVVASATFAEPRPRPAERARYSHSVRPTVPSASEVEPLPVDMPLLPTFAQFFEYRYCVGSIPFASDERALTGGYIRLREPSVVDAPALAALVDSYPPAVFSRLDAPRAASSIDLTIDFLEALPSTHLPIGGNVLLVQRSSFGDGGTADEKCEVWTESGLLLATARQLVALL